MLIGKKYYKYFSRKTILITGASGYISWHLINQLSQLDCTIICLTTNAIKLKQQSKQ